METRANYVLIGLFTLAVIVGAFGFVYWFHHVGGVAVRNYYRVVFQGPIGGLRTGAQVNFNGIRVGEVVDLGLDPERSETGAGDDFGRRRHAAARRHQGVARIPGADRHRDACAQGRRPGGRARSSARTTNCRH